MFIHVYSPHDAACHLAPVIVWLRKVVAIKGAILFQTNDLLFQPGHLWRIRRNGEMAKVWHAFRRVIRRPIFVVLGGSSWTNIIRYQISLLVGGWLHVLTILKIWVSKWEEWHPVYEMENKKRLKPPARSDVLGLEGHQIPAFSFPTLLNKSESVNYVHPNPVAKNLHMFP